MIFSPSFTEIGYIEKTHGNSGALRFNITLQNDSILKRMEFLFLMHNNQPVPYQIKSINLAARIIHFEGLNTPESSTRLTGSKILMMSGEINEKDTLFKPIGYQLFNKDNELLGIICNWIAIKNNPLIVLLHNEIEYDLPWHPDLIIKIDKQNKTITYRLPEGILDL